MNQVAILLILALFPWSASARVFSYKDRSIAAFMRGSGNFSQGGQDGFVHADETVVAFEADKVTHGLGAEIGVYFAQGMTNFRLGLEVYRPNEVHIQGKSAGGGVLYDLESSIFVYSPTLTIEHIYSVGAGMRFYAMVSVGYSFVSLTNKYAYTTAGDAQFTPNSSHSEKGTASSIGGQVGFGFETLFVDNTTISVDFGYRHLVVENYKYTGDTVTNTQGAVAKGDVMKNSDGSVRRTDLGGLSVGVTVKFYIF